MAVRSLWFESHLLGERAGKRARDAATKLGPAVHERILTAGDTLAAVSPAIAQQFYRQAADAWNILGADTFARWLGLGTELITDHATPRDAGFGFFAIAPKAIERAGFEALQRWCEHGRAISQRSRKLGAAFFTSTATWVGRADIALLEAWATHGLALLSVSGWRGEFLAHAYLSGADQALPVFSADDCRDWASLGAALQSAVKEQQFFASLPAGIASLKPHERRWFFGAAIAMAHVSPGPAATFYAELPPAIRLLHTNHRTKLLEAIGLAAPVIPGPLADIAPVAGALVRDLPTAVRGDALDLLVRVARQFPAAIAALLRSLPMAYEDARHEAVVEWITRGLQIAATSEEAGAAYFALESRTSLKVLQASSTAVQLTDVQGLLRKYIQMLSAQPVSIRGSDFIEIPPPLEAAPRELEVELPLRIDLCETHEENVRLYRFLSAHLAGRREFGTYAITLPESAKGNLPEYLQAPEQPKLLERIFIVLEGYRVGRALTRGYPGFGREQRQVCRDTLERYRRETDPGLDQVFDALFVWLLAEQPLDDLPDWLAVLAAIVEPCTPALAFAGATANDSLQLAQTLARELEQRINTVQPGARGEMLGEGLTGDALIAAYLYDDDDAPSVPNDMPGTTNPTDKPPPDKPADPMQLKVEEETDDGEGVTTAMSAEELQKLIEAGVELQLKQGRATDIEGLGMYITDLIGKVPTEQLQELRNLVEEASSQTAMPPKRWLEQRVAGRSYYYDEWDFHISDYRQRWCRLLEASIEGDSGEFFNRALQDYAAMIPEVRRQFQKIRPDMYRVVRGLEDGEDFDFNAVVDARVDRRARRAPSTKLYVARHREERDVATLFLIDMSASTDEPMEKLRPSSVTHEDPLDAIVGTMSMPSVVARPGRRIIDVTKEALVIMAEALEEIGDAYAIYGFSGHGRHNVEFYSVKHFNESLTTAVKGRIGAIEPKRSTRMGTALRHAVEKMSNITARSRHIILLSDGFPQDFDYGQDRRSNVYGLRDTSVALRECEAAGITPFCITVDKAGHDYLRVMCDTSRYMVIDDIAELPRELPKIYQRIVVT